MDKTQKESRPFAFDDIAFVLAEALEGLHHAHGAANAGGQDLAVVHRDFSPSNVLLSYEGDVKVCDFGIAKTSINRIETAAGIIKGKVKYMSPEQAFGYPLDRRSDVFSAGSVLYELCTGAQPFVATSEVELIFAVRDASAKPCRELNPHIPRELVEIIETSMARSRTRRYQSAKEFADALRGFLERNSPTYDAARLARLMKQLWMSEIDDELRSLEAYALDLSSGDIPLGRNLLADALGEGARYEDFHPVPTEQGDTRRDSLPPLETEATKRTGPPSGFKSGQGD